MTKPRTPSAPADDPDLTISQFCSKYHCGRTKAYKLLNAGKIEAVKFDTKTIILGASAKAWAAARPKWKPGAHPSPRDKKRQRQPEARTARGKKAVSPTQPDA